MFPPLTIGADVGLLLCLGYTDGVPSLAVCAALLSVFVSQVCFAKWVTRAPTEFPVVLNAFAWGRQIFHRKNTSA
jgi:hypothetical protein